MFQDGVSVVTTTWKEKENVEKLVHAIQGELCGYQHEIIIIDDDSPDGTIDVAKRYADVAVKKRREGQTKGLLYGMKLAKYPLIVTIDADLENDPAYISELLERIFNFDLVVASRMVIPRFSERFASKTLGKLFGVKDSFSNFRVYRKDIVSKFALRGGETFGAEFLVIAKRNRFRIGEIMYAPPS